MITIDYPHMGLNDERAPVFVQMWNTWKVLKSDTKQHIVDWTAAVARSTSAGKLASIVICCHGAPGYLALGDGIGIDDVGLFEAWQGLVDKVWIRACLVARIVTSDTLKEGDGSFINGLAMSGDGHQFCSKMAQAIKCYLVVGTELQVSSSLVLPYGKLDTYEGLVLSYGPDGTITWSKRYPSVRNANPKTLTAGNPNRE